MREELRGTRSREKQRAGERSSAEERGGERRREEEKGRSREDDKEGERIYEVHIVERSRGLTLKLMEISTCKLIFP